MSITIPASLLSLRKQFVRYTPPALPDGSLLEPVDVYTHGRLDSRRRALNAKIEELLALASLGKPRGDVCVLQAARELAETVLPSALFSKLAAPDVDVELDADETLYTVPYEMFEDVYQQCPKDPLHFVHNQDQFCSHDGERMQRMQVKVGVARSISFTVRPVSPPVVPGRRFLCVIDPKEDLERRGRADADSAARRCQEVHDELEALLASHFHLEKFWGSGAVQERIRREIARQDLAGIYYFGHGFVNADIDDGCLELADDPLLGSDIRDCRPSAPLVFLNACWGASQRGSQAKRGDGPDPGSRLRSVAHAFACGARKSVIGSLWPLEKVRAAEAALCFFRSLLEQKRSVGGALAAARKMSLERYEKGEPEIGWMSYRLLGGASLDPAARRAQLFRTNGKVNFDLFRFDLAEVLAYAVKRRNIQGRLKVSVDDFVSGLLRKGELLRYLCRELGVDPDDTRKWAELRELGPRDPLLSGESQAGSVLQAFAQKERWQIGGRESFEPDLIAVLTAATRGRTAAGEGISERDLLQCMLEQRQSGAAWLPRLAVGMLPNASKTVEHLERDVGRRVDENGCIVLDRLETSARRVIETAHELAQQRGVAPIPEALLFAAFMAEPEGLVARKWRAEWGEQGELRRKLVSSVEPGRERAFALSFEACEGAVRETLNQAEHLAGAERRIDEQTLLAAFARAVPPGFKEAHGLPVGLTELSEASASPVPGARRASGSESAVEKGQATAFGESLDLDRFDESGKRIVQDAVEIARHRGDGDVSSPHLFVALIGAGSTPLAESLRAQGFSPHALELHALRLVRRVRGIEPTRAPGFSRHTRAILESAQVLARVRGSEATAKDIETAFLLDLSSADTSVVADFLTRVGVSISKLRGDG